VDTKTNNEMDREVPVAIDIIGGIVIAIGTMYGIKRFLKEE